MLATKLCIQLFEGELDSGCTQGCLSAFGAGVGSARPIGVILALTRQGDTLYLVMQNG